MNKDIGDMRMRPKWHYRPERNWINDPNGFVYFQGWYHLFYQYNPNGDQWGDIHWGHARSRDLLHWETLPLALYPQKERKEKHCYSGGCCKDAFGVPHFFYTSVGDLEDGLDARHGAYQRLALPVDESLTKLVQDDAFALTQEIHHGMKVLEWRDPCVVPWRGQYLMVLGGLVEGHGCALLYTSLDLLKWTYRHILARSERADGVSWECPNLFFLDGKCALIYSPCSAVRIKLGSLDDGLHFHEEQDEVLDPGAWDGFYAPQVTKDDLGRTVMIGWMPECDGIAHKGWAGVMSLPCVLTLDRDGVRADPVPGVDRLPGVKRLSVLREQLPFAWTVHRSADGAEETVLTLSPEGTLVLDRSRSTALASASHASVRRQVPVKEINEVWIAVDVSTVEVMVNGTWLSARIYPTQ